MRLLYSLCVWAAVVLFTAGTAAAESPQEPSGKRAGGDEGGGEHSREGGDSGEGGEGGGEHSGDGEGGGGSDEESAQQFGLEDTYDHIRVGARLILTYDAEVNAFTGTVENTTSATLLQVRVEVHLSNGTELGPTPPVDLAPGETIPITLEATSDPFDTWSAHPEVGGSEDGSVMTAVQSASWGHVKASVAQ